MTRLLHALVVGGCLATLAGPALADDDVAPVSTAPDGGDAVRRGVQGPEGMLAARVTLASGGLSALGDTLQVPIGLGPVHSFTPHIDVGGCVSFDNLLGHQAAGVGRADTRSIALLLLVRN